MCAVVYTPEKKRLDSNKALEKEGYEVPPEFVMFGGDRDLCLCCMEIEKVLEHNNLIWEYDSVWGDYQILPKGLKSCH